MPNFEQKFKAGTALPRHVRDLLEKFFASQQIEKLEILGGTLSIKISTASRRNKKHKDIQINDTYINMLRRISSDTSALNAELATLTNKQLRKICEQIELPTSSKFTNRELIQTIERRIHAPRRWETIIGE